jgi:hypothetical protein
MLYMSVDQRAYAHRSVFREAVLNANIIQLVAPARRPNNASDLVPRLDLLKILLRPNNHEQFLCACDRNIQPLQVSQQNPLLSGLLRARNYDDIAVNALGLVDRQRFNILNVSTNQV